MKIIWTENPLDTRVELDASDIILLKEKLKVELLKDCLVSARLELDFDSTKTLEQRIANALNTLSNHNLLDELELDESSAMHMQSLLESHCGDCTCVPSTCSKCYAESLMGIDTINGLDKYAAGMIFSAFNTKNNIDDAITWLANYQPSARAGYEVFVPRWIEQSKRAHTWLVAYKETHFVGEK